MITFTSPLITATLVKRYKRFLADVKLSNGEALTAHCPNTGAMTDCAEPGWQVFLSQSDNPKRKYAHTWELAKNHRQEWIGINTNNANKVVKAALQKRHIIELAEYNSIQAEYKVGDSRIDFFLQGDGVPDCYVEVKSVSLCAEGGMGFFPDAITQRGTKHANELAELAKQGHKAVLLFCVQHSGINSVQIARHIDPTYADAVRKAQDLGVLLLAYKCNFSIENMSLADALPIVD